THRAGATVEGAGHQEGGHYRLLLQKFQGEFSARTGPAQSARTTNRKEFKGRSQPSKPGGECHEQNLLHRSRFAVMIATTTPRARKPSARAVLRPVRAILVGETSPGAFLHFLSNRRFSR